MAKKLSNKTKKVLKEFLNEGGQILETAVNLRAIIFHSFGGNPRCLYNLSRSGYLKKTKNKNFTYKITHKGKKELINEIINQKIKNKKNWDKKWRILIFDIPENKRAYRNHMRRTLIEIGFAQLQKSVWVYPFDIIKYLYEIIPGFREGDWFQYIEATKISDQKKLKKRFNLT